MLTTRGGIRPLNSHDLGSFYELCDRDPVVNVFAAYRARTTNLEPRWLGGEVWGRFADGELTAACHVGANLVPIQCTDDDARAFAQRAIGRHRSVATIVGLQRAVEVFWENAERSWSPSREIRYHQPHLEIAADPLVAPDEQVRLTTEADLATVYPACVAMYEEEVGASPEAGGGGDFYRTRVRQLMSQGWSFARFDERGQVIFKAEVACASDRAAQIQGVWVPRHRRGEGLALAGMAAVVQIVRARIAPVVSLYVNEWNAPARAVYEKVGFTESARFGTVLF